MLVGIEVSALPNLCEHHQTIRLRSRLEAEIRLSALGDEFWTAVTEYQSAWYDGQSKMESLGEIALFEAMSDAYVRRLGLGGAAGDPLLPYLLADAVRGYWGWWKTILEQFRLVPD